MKAITIYYTISYVLHGTTMDDVSQQDKADTSSSSRPVGGLASPQSVVDASEWRFRRVCGWEPLDRKGRPSPWTGKADGGSVYGRPADPPGTSRSMEPRLRRLGVYIWPDRTRCSRPKPSAAAALRPVVRSCGRPSPAQRARLVVIDPASASQADAGTSETGPVRAFPEP